MQCIAKANVWRCVGCFVFPFVALAVYAYKVGSVGDDFQSFLARVATGGRPLLSALLVFVGCVVWAVITWPKAREAMQHRACAISLDERAFRLYGDKVERGDIASVKTERRPFDFRLRVQRRDGSSLAKSIILLSPSPDLIITQLQQAGL